MFLMILQFQSKIMVRLPERALVIRRKALEKFCRSHNDLNNLLEFDLLKGETDKLLVYGPYFDYESLGEVCRRLDQLGLQYWDDYFDLKEDIPDWISLDLSEPI